jgi:penicillin-insensitive murein DD-endopeptidase
MLARLILISSLALTVVVVASLAPLASIPIAWAQDKGSLEPKPLPPLENPNDPKLAAKELFARKRLPAALPVHVIGAYNKGCIAGAEKMPITGDTWQVMRLSRNRNWGSPDLVALLKRLSKKAHKDAGWPLSGHASHQIGLDGDVWLTPMPDHLLSRQEREEMSAVMMVREDRLDIDPKVWTPGHLAVIRDAALEPAVQRIFVNAAIKKALCREAKGDRSWLTKVRPWYGHDYHFHIRMRCPAGSNDCAGQPEQNGGDGCNDLAYWFKDSVLHPEPPKEPEKPHPGITLAQLPAACRQVLNAADAKQ